MKQIGIVVASVAVVLLVSGHYHTVGAQSPADPKPVPVASYQVIPYSHNSAVMIDVQTGRSWKLERDAEKKGKFVWVPIRKLETNMEVDDWEQRMKKYRAERRKQRAAEFGEEAIPLDVEPFGFRVELDEPQVVIEP